MYPPRIWVKHYELLNQFFYVSPCVFIAAAGAFFRLNIVKNNDNSLAYVFYLYIYMYEQASGMIVLKQ